MAGGIRSIFEFARSPLQIGVVSKQRACSSQLSSLPSSKPLISTGLLPQRTHCNNINAVILGSQVEEYRTKTLEELVENTRKALKNASDPTSTLKLIDTAQRLGVSHRFEEEIDTQLERFSDHWNNAVDHEDLFVASLLFRLLRHGGKPANSDIFKKFIDEEGKLKEIVTEDCEGLLSLYEASYLGTNNEEILLEAMQLARNRLQKLMPRMPSQSRKYVAQALKFPRHLRMARLEARNYITDHHSNGYSMEDNFTSDLFHLANLDFNMVQQLHSIELDEISRWWKQLGLVDKLSFARDRPLECFLWSVGIFPEPYHSSCRIELTKTIAILLVLDDVFDSYGSLDELVLFTEAIQRWDLSAMEQLPEYMKICYMALYNTTNDIGYKVLKQHGWNIVPFLKRTWIDIVEAFLVEAKWFNKGYVPTIEEYLNNGVATGGTYMALVHAFFLMGQDVTNETAANMEPYPKLFSVSGQILRLWDDLGTAQEEQERGDVASSIQCYMNENSLCSENEAREHIRNLIRTSWLELNSELVRPSTALPLSIIKASLNLGRTAQVVYQHGDDENASSVSDHVQALFYRPIN